MKSACQRGMGSKWYLICPVLLIALWPVASTANDPHSVTSDRADHARQVLGRVHSRASAIGEGRFHGTDIGSHSGPLGDFRRGIEVRGLRGGKEGPERIEILPHASVAGPNGFGGVTLTVRQGRQQLATIRLNEPVLGFVINHIGTALEGSSPGSRISVRARGRIQIGLEQLPAAEPGGNVELQSLAAILAAADQVLSNNDAAALTPYLERAPQAEAIQSAARLLDPSETARQHWQTYLSQQAPFLFGDFRTGVVKLRYNAPFQWDPVQQKHLGQELRRFRTADFVLESGWAANVMTLVEQTMQPLFDQMISTLVAAAQAVRREDAEKLTLRFWHPGAADGNMDVIRMNYGLAAALSAQDFVDRQGNPPGESHKVRYFERQFTAAAQQ